MYVILGFSVFGWINWDFCWSTCVRRETLHNREYTRDIQGMYWDFANILRVLRKIFILVSTWKLQSFKNDSANCHERHYEEWLSMVLARPLICRSVAKFCFNSSPLWISEHSGRQKTSWQSLFPLIECTLPQGALLRDVWERCFGENISIIDRQGPAQTCQCQKWK